MTFLLSSAKFVIVESCIATSPITGAVSTSAPVTDEPVTDEPVTDEPVTDEPLRACSPTGIPLGMGDTSTPQLAIDVTYRDFVSTRIGDTLDTTSTMVVTCSAIDGYFADMNFDNGFYPLESTGNPTTISVTLSCSSVDMRWRYEVTVNGVVEGRDVLEVTCDQYSLSPIPSP